MKPNTRIVKVSESGESYFKVQVRCRFLFWRYWADSPDPDILELDRIFLREYEPIPAKRFASLLAAETYLKKCAFPETLSSIPVETVVAQYE